MSEVVLLYRQELKAFLKSGKSSLFLLLFTTLVWGGVIAGKVDSIRSIGSFLWVLVFAIVAGAGLSTTVFVRERLSATLEVLFISGVERSSVLYGKLLFTSTTTIVIGMVAFLIAFGLRTLFFDDTFFLLEEVLLALLLYCSASLMVSSSSAFFSMALSNPRMVQFVNFTLLSILSTIYSLIAHYFGESLQLFSLFLFLLSLLFIRLSLWKFKGEKILQPLIY